MFSHGIHSSCCMFSHGIHGTHRTFLLYILPRNSQNTQNFLAVKCLPQIARIFTDAAFKWVHLRICVEWNPWKNIPQQPLP